ncbi:MAG: nickel pincer cofactor biosynthesis protein LarC [Aminipila sp.]
MSKILYLECYSGISGDMTVGALLDLGANREKLEEQLASLNLKGYHLHFGRTKKCGIDAFQFDVHVEENQEHNINEHDHCHGENHHHDHHHDENHHHDHHHDHCHEHHHEHHDDHHHVENHHHRNINDIYSIIESLNSNENVKELAKKIFNIVAEAESNAHGISMEEVHFHEVGAIDSIVDIIGTAICIDDLKIDKVIVSTLYEGQGFAKCAHGIIPVPVPATINIAVKHSLKMKTTKNIGEMVTPTGAAIAAALNCMDNLPEEYTIKKVGLGAGKKDFDNANILRAMIIEDKENQQDCEAYHNSNKENLYQLDTNIDDCSGEALGFTLERLFDKGCLDAWYTPIYMKKNRPAYLLSVICKDSDLETMEDIIFSGTTTTGIRKTVINRDVLQRRVENIETPYGAILVKIVEYKNKKYFHPEYESIKNICLKYNKGFQEIYQETMIILENMV